MRYNKYRFGFTIIELMIVMGIIGVLASLVLFTYPSARKRSRDTHRISDMKQYQIALENHANSHDGLYPTGSGAMNSHCAALGLTAPCAKDPNNVSYNYISLSFGAAYIIWGRLEQPAAGGATQYFVVCSNGNSGMTTTSPSGAGSCPI